MPIPVLTYHSVGPTIPNWRWNFLTVPQEVFEDHLRWIVRKGYRTIDLGELHDHMTGKHVLDSACVVLTFDDGYLDNWTFAAPLLRKYGLKATVFVHPDFVDPRPLVRSTLEEVWAGTVTEDQLEVAGFMSWEELRSLHDSGVFSVQSHLMTHTWYPVSSDVVDFHHPDDEYYWLDWNADAAAKPFYVAATDRSKVPFGVPVYENAKAMVAKRYFPPPEESDHMASYVARHGGERFFSQENWSSVLHEELARYREAHPPGGRVETEQQRRERVSAEIHDSKQILEDRLSADVRHLSWPGGAYDAFALQLGQEVYRSVTIGSYEKTSRRNAPGEDARRFRRIGVPCFQCQDGLRYANGRYLTLLLDEFREIRLARRTRQAIKSMAILRERLHGAWRHLSRSSRDS